jgi:putative glutamine amidotransferase
LKRPIIGISSRTIFHSENGRPYNRFGVAVPYTQAVEAAGGVPLILPLTDDRNTLSAFLEIIDGLLLSGGYDVDPSFYNEEPHVKLGRVDPLRDRSEAFLASRVLAADRPVLGVCRGLQLLNVVAGGTLYQDIDTEREGKAQGILHYQDFTYETASHSVRVLPETTLFGIIREERIRVNSYHHQCVKDVARGFRVSALAPDGVIEGIESEKHFFVVGVQWHPEILHANADFNLALFRALVEAAGARSPAKRGSVRSALPSPPARPFGLRREGAKFFSSAATTRHRSRRACTSRT